VARTNTTIHRSTMVAKTISPFNPVLILTRARINSQKLNGRKSSENRYPTCSKPVDLKARTANKTVATFTVISLLVRSHRRTNERHPRNGDINNTLPPIALTSGSPKRKVHMWFGIFDKLNNGPCVSRHVPRGIRNTCCVYLVAVT